MRLGVVYGLVGLTWLIGCAAFPPSHPIVYPITSGFHTTLPPRNARLLVWGKQPVTGTATTWLQTHGFSAIPPDGVRRWLAPELREALTDTSEDAPLILRHAQHAGADLLLLADFEVMAEPASRVMGNFSPTQTMDVTVRGINVNTGAVEWKGNAHYPPRSELPSDGLAQLTCQALATAWGFRPSGQLEIPSRMMCTAGQLEPVLSP